MAEHLSTQDAALWTVQDRRAPLLIGGVGLFEGRPLRDDSGALRIDDLRRHVACRIQRLPRFRHRIWRVPGGLGLVWVDDEHFDVAHHVHAAALPRPRGLGVLWVFVEHLQVSPLDPSRPLWELWFVDGVDDDRIACIPKVSHVMADGMALLDFVLSLLDAEPVDHADEPVPGWRPTPRPTDGELVAGALVERARRQAGAIRQLTVGFADPGRLGRSLRAATGSASAVRKVAPRLPITRPVGSHRGFAHVSLPLADLLRVKRAEQTTLNDVALAVTAGALAHYLVDRGVPLDGPAPRVLVPVSTHVTPGEEVENRFSMMVADLPVGLADPVARLRAIHTEMDAHKQGSQSSIGPLLFSLGDLVPQQVLRAVGPPALRRQPFVNLAVTNLPGTRAPGYLLGAQMLEAYPWVCGTGNISLIVGVLSYLDALGVGITVDADVIDDVEVLAGAFERAARELVEAVDTASTTPRRRRRTGSP